MRADFREYVPACASGHHNQRGPSPPAAGIPLGVASAHLDGINGQPLLTGAAPRSVWASRGASQDQFGCAPSADLRDRTGEGLFKEQDRTAMRPASLPTPWERQRSMRRMLAVAPTPR